MNDEQTVPVGQAPERETAGKIRPVKTVPVAQAVEAETAGNLSIKMRTHLWISWARIALKHEAMARAARRETQQPGADQSRLLLQEADAGSTASARPHSPSKPSPGNSASWVPSRRRR